eukprot:3940227-Rhodomonas_salina.2
METSLSCAAVSGASSGANAGPITCIRKSATLSCIRSRRTATLSVPDRAEPQHFPPQIAQNRNTFPSQPKTPRSATRPTDAMGKDKSSHEGHHYRLAHVRSRVVDSYAPRPISVPDICSGSTGPLVEGTNVRTGHSVADTDVSTQRQYRTSGSEDVGREPT